MRKQLAGSVHVRAGSHAHEGHGDTGSGVHLLCLMPVNRCRCNGPSHSYRAHDAIRDELVACTLGARSRPELAAWAPAEGGVVSPGRMVLVGEHL